MTPYEEWTPCEMHGHLFGEDGTCVDCGEPDNTGMSDEKPEPPKLLDWCCTACGTVTAAADRHCVNCGRKR